jgi:hypothetical protein
MIKNYIKNLVNKIFSEFYLEDEKNELLMGKILTNQVKSLKNVKSYSCVEFSVFSQFGDDGIIQYLINKIDIDNKIFIEFGVEDYAESNTRFLMMNNNWSGFVMDGSKKKYIKTQSTAILLEI